MLISCRYGFVKFSNPEDAEEGLKLNGLVYKGRTIKVDVAKDLQPTGMPFF